MAQVQGEEIYLSHSGQEVDDNIDEVVAARGSEASLSARLADIVSDFETDQQRQETEIGAVATLGAKNLLNDKALNATSGTGVTITPNGDGTYALSGTPTGTATYLYTSLGNYTNLLGLETEKSYTITAGSNKVLIRVDYSTNGTSLDNGEDGQPLVSNVAGGASFTIPASAVGLYIRFRSTTSSGSLNGIVLKPMIRRAEITDDTFQPYAPTNRELYEAKADKGTFQLAISGAPLSASLYSYSCITTGDIATVCIRIVLADELDVSTSTRLFQLPAGYYPGITVAGIGYADTKLRTLWINSAGEIRIKVDEKVPAGSTIIASFCYSFRSSNWKTVTPNSTQSAASLMQAGRIDAELTDVQEVTENDT